MESVGKGGGREGGRGVREGSTLSSEQVCRMEENRKRAQERLAMRRRVGGPHTGGPDSCSISQPTSGGLNFKTPQSFDIPNSAGSWCCVKRPFSAKTDPSDAATSNAPSIHPCSTSDSSQRLSNGPCISRPATSVSSTSHIRGSHGSKVAHPTSLHSRPVTSTAAATTHLGSSGGTSAGGCSVTDGPNRPKFAALQKKICANFTLVSRTQFKAIVPYDSSLIEVFKMIPSRSYGRVLGSC